MRRRFELQEGTSNKFWEIAVEGSAHTVRFGRLGTTGQTKTKTFVDAPAALRDAEKLIREKTGKAYREVDVEPGAAAPARSPVDEPTSEGSLLLDALARIEAWMRKRHRAFLRELNPPIDDAAVGRVRAAHEKYGALGPAIEPLFALYRWRNGQTRDDDTLFLGHRRFLSAEEGVEVREMNLGCLENGDFEAPNWWRHGWIPFLEVCGNAICVDLEATWGGVSGQIVNHWHDDARRTILAPSLEAYLAAFADGLERSGYRPSDEDASSLIEAVDLAIPERAPGYPIYVSANDDEGATAAPRSDAPADAIVIAPGEDLAARLTSAPDGASFLLKRGSHKLSSLAAVKQSASFFGEGRARTILAVSSGNEDALGGERWAFEDLALDARGKVGCAAVVARGTLRLARCALRAGKAKQTRKPDGTFDVQGGIAVYASGTAAIEIVDCEMEAEVVAVYLGDDARATVRGGTNTSRFAAVATERTSLELDGVEGTGDIHAHGRARLSMTGTRTAGHIHLEGSVHATLRQATIRNEFPGELSEKGIGIIAKDDVTLLVDDCDVLACRRHGLSIRDRARAEVLGSRVSHNRGSGIEVTSAGIGRIDGCKLHANKVHGIELAAGAEIALGTNECAGNLGSNVSRGGKRVR